MNENLFPLHPVLLWKSQSNWTLFDQVCGTIGTLVMDNIIECPKHNGRFDVRTGRALGAPVCVNLKTYPAKVDGGRIFIQP